MILPEGFDDNSTIDQQVEQLVASGLYSQNDAERIVRLLADEAELPIE